ncbi:MAG TPA: TraR/DksA C4-type zinc finger protein [Streptosporangiaceae bacterium]|jgi:DnaK suppressor protein
MAGTAHTDAASLLVRPGEEQWTEAELDEVRTELESDVTGLNAEIAKAESNIAERMGGAVADAGDDPADTADKTFQREHDLVLTHNARELLAQNERALAHIAAGSYGMCESCGKAIGKGRLQAYPRATKCVECKQREERR